MFDLDGTLALIRIYIKDLKVEHWDNEEQIIIYDKDCCATRVPYFDISELSFEELSRKINLYMTFS